MLSVYSPGLYPNTVQLLNPESGEAPGPGARDVTNRRQAPCRSQIKGKQQLDGAVLVYIHNYQCEPANSNAMDDFWTTAG